MSDDDAAFEYDLEQSRPVTVADLERLERALADLRTDLRYLGVALAVGIVLLAFR